MSCQRVAAVVFTVLLISVIPAAAQDDLPVGMPDPSEIFAEGVTVSHIEVILPEEDIVQLDNDQRLARIYDVDDAQWNEYPFPDDAPELNGYARINETEIAIRTGYGTNAVYLPYSETWILNTVSGEIYRPANTQCGVTVFQEHERWIYYEEAQVNRAAFCNILTGEFAFLFPRDFTLYQNYRFNLGPMNPVLSPDGNYLLFAGWDSQTSPSDVTIYTYHLLTEEVFRVGDIPLRGENLGLKWASTNFILASTRDMPEWSVCNFYAASPHATDGLRNVISSIRLCPTINEDMVTLQSEFDRSLTGSGETLDCWIDYYNLETSESWTVNYGDLCWAEYTAPSGRSYYRDVDYESYAGEYPDTARLVRFNVETGEIVPLYTGELERIVWVSEDEHFAILVIGQNGKIDLSPGWDQQFGLAEQGRLAYVDLLTGQILYEASTIIVPNFDGWAIRDLGIVTGDIRIIAPDQLLVIDAPSQNANRLIRVHLNDVGGYTEEVLAENIVSTLTDSRYLLYQSADGTLPSGAPHRSFPLQISDATAEISLYDAATDTLTPIINGFDDTLYTLTIQSVQDDQMVVRVEWQTEDQPYRSRVDFTLTLP